MGITSRRQAEKWIEDGRISVNGKVLSEQGYKLDLENDQVTVDGKLVAIKQPPKVYWLFNKPDMYLTAAKSENGKECIFDLPMFRKLPFRVFAAGRLDYRTEGLLILSNDGDFVHKLTHPKYKLPRSYYVLVNGKLDSEQINQIEKGIKLKDGVTLPAKITVIHGKNLGKTQGTWYSITVYEGRNRLVRRLFEHFDLNVVKLVRYAFGDITLPEKLSAGDYKQLSKDDIQKFKNHFNKLES
jgi:23S rRNA pseudouridine2605 synthase